jgi:hypothetical protein
MKATFQKIVKKEKEPIFMPMDGHILVHLGKTKKKALEK